VLKSVFEITGGLPILVWENEGGACARESKSAKPIRSEETFYLHNLTKELENGLENNTLTRPDRLDGSDCPDVGWTSPMHRNVYKIGKRSKSH
jgi:hypothetical protein